MIDESIRIKLNQFMLAYERQCSELEFQKQNIKQNVMLSIIENKNVKKNNKSAIINTLEKSIVKSKVNQNLASSKQTKFSQQKQPIDYKYMDSERHDNYFEQMQRSKIGVDNNSRLLEKSNISIKDNKSNRLKNNFVNQKDDDRNEAYQQLAENQRSSILYNNSYLKPGNKAVDVQQMDENQDENMNVSQKRSYLKNQSPKNVNNAEQNSSKMIKSQLKEEENMKESSISRKNLSRISQKRHEQQLQSAYLGQKESQSGVFVKKSMVGSKVFPNSQKVIKQNNPSIMRQQEQQNQLQNYPTFKKPSFQFITNLSQLRQSNPQNQDQENRDQQQEQLQQQNVQEDEQNDYNDQNDDQQQKQQILHKKWGGKQRNNQWDEAQEDEQDDYNPYQKEQRDQSFIKENQSNAISNIQEDQSMIITSQFKQKLKQKQPEPSRKSYMAFEINMEKSNLPQNENLQQLKKKKILELEKKRLERMQNNSKRKLNPSQINTPTQKQSKYQEKPHSNVFIGSNRQISRKQPDHRDSLNKSINDKKQQKNKNIKNSGFRQQQIGNKDSMFQDNHTVITKYGQQSKISKNNRSISPLNTVKTIHTTDKRPPLNRNKRQQNIFAGDSGFQRNQGESGFQKQRSVHKISDPKIVPIDRKNSFQKKTNIKIMINAITYTCLPGELNRRERQKLIDILDDYESEFFIFLFKEYSRKVIKGIYILESGQDRLARIYGDKAPMEIFPQQIHQFYRFDSGSRQFKKIDGCKTFSFSVHAVDLK